MACFPTTTWPLTANSPNPRAQLTPAKPPLIGRCTTHWPKQQPGVLTNVAGSQPLLSQCLNIPLQGSPKSQHTQHVPANTAALLPRVV